MSGKTLHESPSFGNMSGRSSPLDSENDPGHGNSSTEEDGEEDQAISPLTPSTAEILTDKSQPFQRFQYRLEVFQEQEQGFFERIKVFDDVDEGDNGNSRYLNSLPRRVHVKNQTSMVALSQKTPYTQLTASGNYGKLVFEGEEDLEASHSWYFRTAIHIPVDLLRELLTRLELTDTECRPLKIHCIDYNHWPSDEQPPRHTDLAELPARKEQEKQMSNITLKLSRDLWSMCNKIAGVVLTWSGLAGDNSMIHQALAAIVEDARISQRFPPNLAAIATPPWSALSHAVQTRLKDKKQQGGKVVLKSERASSPSHEEPDTSYIHRRSLGPEISPYASHFFLLDDEMASETFLETSIEKSNFRHFHYRLLEAMDSIVDNSVVPVICLLVNGHFDALKMVDFALGEHVPVVVIKDSGGFADIIADVYLNADMKSIKERDENTGQVRTRTQRSAGERGDFYLKAMGDNKVNQVLLRRIFKFLDLLTVYVPAVSVQSLDSIVYEALLKNKRVEMFRGLLEDMQNAKRGFQPSDYSTESGGLLESTELQMDFFLEALKQNNVEIVRLFLDSLHIHTSFMQHFHLGRILRLYAKGWNKSDKLIDFRKNLRQMLKKLTLFPVRCVCDNCPNCDVPANAETPEMELELMRTCLHPIQELFLWTLHEHNVDMAVVFWERCDNKIAAALVAQRVFQTLAKKTADADIKWQMLENVKQFQELAVRILKSCHQMDEVKTELLLVQPCVWWGGVSVLQLAIMADNRPFMTHTACKEAMTRIWRGQHLSDPKSSSRPCKLVDDGQRLGCCNGRVFSPRVKYGINFLVQIVFLGLFSYGLLSDLGHGITPIFICLIVWVAALTYEEFRQLLSIEPVVSNSVKQTEHVSLRRKLRIYLKQGWNVLDVITILLFWLGMTVFIPLEATHWVGRVLLSLDIFFFFMRLFQMLMVFSELGLMLVMVYKMIKDTRNFMVILLVFILAYSVASESLLYPESDLTWARVFHLPRKAYWQVFGELMLDEIEIRESGSCSSGNVSKHFGYDTPHCPTYTGSYIVPILMGFHVMITNVLLVNLLIARFGVTFNKVLEEAREYQSWHRCQIITEYFSRKALPPPFNILDPPLSLCGAALRCLRRCCRSPRSRGRRDSQVALKPMGGSVQGAVNSAGVSGREENDAAGQGEQLLAKVTARRSADRRSMDIFWDRSLDATPKRRCPTTLLDNPRWRRTGEAEILKVYTVKVSTSQDAVPVVYKVAQKPWMLNKTTLHALTVWELEPSAKYTVTVQDQEAAFHTAHSSLHKEDLLYLLRFESKEAKWVRSQQDAESALVKDLKSRTDELKSEMKKIVTEVKEKNDIVSKEVVTVKKHTETSSDLLKGLTKSSKEHRKSTKQHKENLKIIDESITKIHSFIINEYDAKIKEAEDIRVRAKVLDKDKDMAEFLRDTAEKEKEQAKKEKKRVELEKEQLEKQKEQVEMEKERLEQEKERAEKEKGNLEKEKERVMIEKQRVEGEKYVAEQDRRQALEDAERARRDLDLKEELRCVRLVQDRCVQEMEEQRKVQQELDRRLQDFMQRQQDFMDSLLSLVSRSPDATSPPPTTPDSES